MPNKYADVNQFLQMFFEANTHKDRYIRYFANVVNGLTNNPDIKYIQNWMQDAELSEELRTLFNQYIAAKQDNSPEAQDFLNRAKVLTFFTTDAWQDKSKNPEFKALNILRLVGDNNNDNNKDYNKIKNPLYAYRLLRQIPKEAVSKETLKEISRLIAQNPYSDLYDVRQYAQFVKSPEELRKLINDCMVKMDNALEPERKKDILDERQIEKILDGTVAIKNMVADLSDLTADNPQEIRKNQELLKIINDKYDIKKILDIKSGDYIQQYKDQAELQLAILKPEIEKMRKDFAFEHDLQNQQADELTQMREEIEKLKRQLQQKDVALQNAESKYNMLKGQVNLYIRDVTERANGSMFGKGKDLADLAMQLQSQINQSK